MNKVRHVIYSIKMKQLRELPGGYWPSKPSVVLLLKAVETPAAAVLIFGPPVMWQQ